MTTRHRGSIALLALASCLQSQKPPPDPAAAGREIAAAMREQFAAEKIAIDLAAGTVSVPATVNEPPDPIEYLLIHRRGKRHEALFWTMSKPSVLNAALLLLGLSPGKNATYRPVEPPPTLEEIERGVDPVIVTPPEGTQFWMTVRFEDGAGKHEYCVEDLIADLRAQVPVRDASWIYLGGRMASLYKDEPEVYVADIEGNLVSICYLAPDNHLGTMRHERARDDDNWWLTEKVPPAGTEVQFVFHKQKTKLHEEREKRLAEAERKAKEEGTGKDPGK
jgi:hypothetical protein